MKTRQIFHPLFLLALLVVAGGFSQRALAQYQSFFGDSITECSIGGNFVTYDPYFFGVESYELSWTCSDTITIIDNHYFQIDNPYPIWEWMDNNIYLREDANMGRVYRYDPYCDCELLICDMSMEEGDTFLFPYSVQYYGVDENPSFGIVDSVWYNNGRKIIRLQSDIDFISNRIDTVMFIEGIGPTYSIMGWGDGRIDCTGSCEGYWGWYPILLCVHKDGELVFMADERAGCEQLPPCKIEDKATKYFQLYPNPTRNFLNIQITENCTTRGMVRITNMYGCVVYSQHATSAHMRINVRSLSPGTYVVSYINNGEKTMQKFIKQ